MSIPGLMESLTLPIAVLPDALATSISSIGVGYTLDAPSKARTYCMIAKPVDPINPNILMWTDDPQVSKWTSTNVTTGLSITDPDGGTNAWSVEADNVAVGDRLYQRFKHNGELRWWYAGPRGITYSGPAFIAARVTLRAGGAGADDDTAGFTLYDEDEDSAWHDVGHIRKLWGPGTTSATATKASITGLSETDWTQVEVYWDEWCIAGNHYRFQVYPGGYAQNDGNVQLYRPQVQYALHPEDPVTGLVTTDPRVTEDRNTDAEISGGEVSVFVSNLGYVSHEQDSPADTLFRAGLIVPYQMNIRLDSGDAFDKPPSVNAGIIEFANTDGFFDRVLEYSWAGCLIEVYQGEELAPFSTFQKILVGTCEDVTWSHDTVTLQLRDSTQKVNKLVQENLFGGFDQCLRGTGLAEIALTDQHPSCWIHGDLTIECRVRMAATPTNNSNVLAMFSGVGSAEADNAAFRFYLDSSLKRLVFGWEYGSSPAWEQFSTDNGSIPTAWLSDNLWHHVAVTRDTEGKDLYVFIDGEEVSLKQDYTNDPSGGWTGLLAIGADVSGASNEFDGDIDELRIWGVVRTEDEITSNKDTIVGNAHPDLVAYYRHDEGLGTTTYEETTLLAEKDQFHRCIRWNGTDAHGLVTDDDDLGPHASFTIECAFYPGPYNATDNLNIYYWKNLAYKLWHRSSDDALVFAFYDTTGTTWREVTIDSSDTVDVSGGEGRRWLRVAVSWSDITQEFNTYVEGELTKTYRNPDAGTTDWNAGDGGGASLRFGYNGTYFYANWTADWRYWSAVVAPDDIAEWYDKALLSAHPNWSTNLQAWYDCNETSGDAPNQKTPTPPVGDMATTNETWVATDAELDSTNPATWVGTGEGATGIAGKPKPIALGQCFHVPLLLVDPVHNVYFAGQGPLQADDGAFEGGVPLEGAAAGATDLWEYDFQAASLDAFLLLDAPSSYVNDTSHANDSTTGNVELLPGTPAEGDGFYVGLDSVFAGIDLWMNVAAEGEATAWDWEYYNGTSWEALPNVRDHGDGFRKLMSYIAYGPDDEVGGDKGDDLTGTNKDRVAIRWSIPSDWAATTVDGAGDYFYIRATIATGSEPPSNQPLASTVWAIMLDYAYDLERGLYRLQSYPRYKLTANVKGHADPAYVNEAGPMMWRLASEWGGLEADEKYYTLDDFGADVALGYYIGSERKNLLKALSQIASSVHGQPYINKAGALSAVTIPIPEEESPEFWLGPEMWQAGSLTRQTTGLPSWQEVVGFQPYWGAYSRAELNWGRIQRSSTVEDLQQAFRIEKATTTRNKVTWVGAPDNFVGTGIVDADDAQAEAAYRQKLYSTRRHIYSVTYPFGYAFAYDIGKVMGLDSEGRFNFPEAGKVMVIVGFQEDPVNQLITLTVWG